ncbi:hypothetical protein [Carboxylicivirga taeanensis]|uniref:hypothetical protein n=1 Tax=Carboxylicivirga taeanensis TaxID=1416875 RepID=UPI003F6DB390
MRAFFKENDLKMDGLYIDLVKKQGINYMRLIAGLAMVGATIYLAIYSEQQRFTITHLSIFFIAGLYYAVLGAGFNPLSLVGKAYIRVDENEIAVKKSIWSKAIDASWDMILEVQLNITAIRVKLKNGDSFEFDYQMLNDDTAHELKTRLALTAKSKDIEVN